MEKSEFDVVIIGGGHNALTCAAYLGRAGVDACVLEGRHEFGGAVYTAEHTAPGFCHNIHANFMEFLHIMPFFSDFDLESLGARTIYPEAQAGIAFSDGRPPVVVYRNDMIERTCENFAVYSGRDAETWRALKTRANQLEPLLAMDLYTPRPRLDLTEPLPQVYQGATALMQSFGLDQEMAYKSIRDCIDELFETDEAVSSSSPACSCPDAGA